MADVARRANVSLSTVSYALNSTRPVAVDTRERVFSAMAELGYRMHRAARASCAPTRAYAYSPERRTARARRPGRAERGRPASWPGRARLPTD